MAKVNFKFQLGDNKRQVSIAVTTRDSLVKAASAEFKDKIPASFDLKFLDEDGDWIDIVKDDNVPAVLDSIANGRKIVLIVPGGGKDKEGDVNMEIKNLKEKVASLSDGLGEKRKADKEHEEARKLQAKKLRLFLADKGEQKSEAVTMETDDGDEESYELRGLRLEQSWLLPRAPKTLIVRPCFHVIKQLIAQALKRPQPVLLVGSLGTGKTQFAVWLAHELAASTPVPIVIDIFDGVGAFLLVRPDSQVKPASGDQPAVDKVEAGTRGVSFSKELDDPNTLYLFDARDAAPSPLQGITALILASTSPSRKEMQQWKQKNNPAQLIMPLWSKAELLACRNLCFPQVKLEEFEFLYAHWGGIVRHTLADLAFGFEDRDKAAVEGLNKTADAIMMLDTDDGNGEEAKLMSPIEFSMALLRSKLGSNTFEFLTSFVGQGDCMADKGDRILHSLLHIDSQDCQHFTLQFASLFVCEELLKQDGRFSEAKCEQFLESHTQSFYAAVRGQVFEAYAHRRLSAPGAFATFPCKEMFAEVDSKTKEVTFTESDVSDEEKKKFNFPSHPVQRKFGKLAELKAGEYGVPQSRNYPAVDSLVRPSSPNDPAVCFQMSAKDESSSGQHGYWQHALVSLRKDLKLSAQQPLFALLVAPPDRFAAVHYQPLWVKGKSGGKKQAEKVATGLKTMRQFKLSVGWTRAS